MKIKLDENLPARLAPMLAGSVHEVHAVAGEVDAWGGCFVVLTENKLGPGCVG